MASVRRAQEPRTAAEALADRYSPAATDRAARNRRTRESRSHACGQRTTEESCGTRCATGPEEARNRESCPEKLGERVVLHLLLLRRSVRPNRAPQQVQLALGELLRQEGC